MNILTLDQVPRLCAKWHNDVHVNSQLKEGVQIMSAACSRCGVWTAQMYKVTHRNHPCSIWAASSFANMDWLYQLVFELNNEYIRRRVHKGKPDVDHRSYEIAEYIWLYISDKKRVTAFPDGPMTPWAQVMPLHYTQPLGASPIDCGDGVHPQVQAYRDYYRAEKRELRNSSGKLVPATWTPDGPPPWWTEEPASVGDPDTIFDDFF